MYESAFPFMTLSGSVCVGAPAQGAHGGGSSPPPQHSARRILRRRCGKQIKGIYILR